MKNKALRIGLLFGMLAMLGAGYAEARSLRIDMTWAAVGSQSYLTATVLPTISFPAPLTFNIGAPPVQVSSLFNSTTIVWASGTTVYPQGDEYDAQTYPDFAACNAASTTCINYPGSGDADCDPADFANENARFSGLLDYFQCNAVPGLNITWPLPLDGSNATEQVLFFNLGSIPNSVPPWDPSLYDAAGNALVASGNAWEIQFNCDPLIPAACPDVSPANIAASLLWSGGSGAPVLYTATHAVLTGTQYPLSGTPVVTSPSGETLLNEFVYNGTTLTAPPGWQSITIAAPGAPSAAPGNGTITLSWTPTAGADSYNIYQSSSTGAEGTTPAQTGNTTGSIVISGLTNGQTYYFKVAAVYKGVVSNPSAESKATVLAAPPTGLSAAAAASSILLTWKASAGANTYNIYEGTSAGGESTAAVTTGLTATSYTVNGLTPGKVYYFYAVAVNPGGKSTASNEVSKAVLAAVPTMVSATPGNGSVTVSWVASSGAGSYVIYQGTSTGAESMTPAPATIAGTTGTVTGLTNGQTYYFEVAAVDAGGPSAPSTEVTAMPQQPAMTMTTSHGGGATSEIELIILGLLLAVQSVRRRSLAAEARTQWTKKQSTPTTGL